MRVVGLLMVCSIYGCLLAQDSFHSNSYYVSNQSDTVFGEIKLERKSESFQIVKNENWIPEKIHLSEAKSFCKNGLFFEKKQYKGKTKFLQVLGNGLYQYHPKKEKFFNYRVTNDIWWPDNNQPNMRNKYTLYHNGKSLYINRFNYKSMLTNEIGMSEVLADNCHFYELELDIVQMQQ